MKKSIKPYCFLALSFVLLAFSDSHAGNIVNCSVVIFGNYQKNPKTYLVNGEPRGVLVDMLSHIGKDVGCEFTIKLCPWQRAYNNMLNGQGGIIGLSKTNERLEIIDYSNVMFYDDLMIVVKKGHEFEFNSIEDFRGKKVIASRGASYGNEWEQALLDGVFEFIEDNGNISSRIKFVLAGRADIALVGPGTHSINVAMSKKPLSVENRNEISVLKKPFKRDPNYLGFAKDSNMKTFLKRINKAIKKGNESGAFKEILQKYNAQ